MKPFKPNHWFWSQECSFEIEKSNYYCLEIKWIYSQIAYLRFTHLVTRSLYSRLYWYLYCKRGHNRKDVYLSLNQLDSFRNTWVYMSTNVSREFHAIRDSWVLNKTFRIYLIHSIPIHRVHIWNANTMSIWIYIYI